MHRRDVMLVNCDGQRLDSRIERTLVSFLPRLRRQFPLLSDEATLTDVLERAGQRLSRREAVAGQIENLPGYAWVVLRSVAASEMRRGSKRIVQNTVASTSGEEFLASTPSSFGTAKDIERAVLLREALQVLSPEERLMCVWKRAGFSSREIAKFQGRSVAAVDTLLSRIRQKVRAALGTQKARFG
jgi:DNA-directed RNA polymerase specialized sigma24 family protein